MAGVAPRVRGPSVDLGHRLLGVLTLAMHLGFAEVERFPEVAVAVVQRHLTQGSPQWLTFALGRLWGASQALHMRGCDA